MKFSIVIAGLVAVAMSEINVEPEEYFASAMPALTRDTVCPGQRQFCLKVPKCEILMSWILMIFLS
jgi:hypothetical protein